MTLSQKREMLHDKLKVIESKIKEAETIFAELIDEVKIISGEEAGVNVQSGQLEEACRLFYYARDGYEAVDEARKKLYFQLELMSRGVIPDIMEDKEVKNLTLSDIGRQFVKVNDVSTTVLDKDAAYQWLRDNGKGDLIQPTVHPSSLKSFAKAYMEESQMDLPDCFKVSRNVTVSIRKKGE